jgi:hypothetical protein
MIAAGIFALPVLAVEEGETVTTLSFIIAALVAVFTAVACAELFPIHRDAECGYTYTPNPPVFKRSIRRRGLSRSAKVGDGPQDRIVRVLSTGRRRGKWDRPNSALNTMLGGATTSTGAHDPRTE